MRIWLIVLIVAAALSSIPLLLPSIPYMRSALSFVQRSIPERVDLTKQLATTTAFSHIRQSTTTPHHTKIMTDSLPQQTLNPMQVLEKAGPADPKKAEELPKLSADEFRVYNRLAVMMDAYVSFPPTLSSPLSSLPGPPLTMSPL